MNISSHDGTEGISEAETALGSKQDILRYGFITLMDTEVKVGEAGTMASKLHYFGDNLNTIREDTQTPFYLNTGGMAHHDQPDMDPALQLSLAERLVRVEPMKSRTGISK
ncbi:hypothetical protein MBH78_21660 [Oceanimonas sp. NS1]|nr:hypothetical protein [Oceanimonas sp. NS1]